MSGLRVALLFAVVGAGACGGQVVPDESVGGALRSLASRAGVVFVGDVASIERHEGVVEISFAVEQPVLGAVGGVYVLREWGGLWPPGSHRFCVGQRVMVFLHAVGRGGLSSPVDGMEGVVPLVAGTLLDVGRLQTRVRRERGAALAGGVVSLADAVEVVVGWSLPLRREPVVRALHAAE